MLLAALALSLASPPARVAPDLPEVVLEAALGRFYTPAFARCRADPPTSDLDCFAEETARWDARLNKAYRAALTGPAQQSADLRRAQRAWIAYRDADCTAYADDPEGGTIQRTWAASCLLRMTALRALELEDFPPSGCGKAEC